MLEREFYLQDGDRLARALLGKRLVHKTPQCLTAGVIVETEAYLGGPDKGAHSYGNRRTPRTEIQFGPGGFAYVYAIYGLHACFNVVAGPAEVPHAVLIRALEPEKGVELMKSRRKTDRLTELCNGPGKLCQAMGITRAQYGLDLCGPELYMEEAVDVGEGEIMASPRVNIDYAEECRDLFLRYYIGGSPWVSKVPKRYTGRRYL